MKQEHTGNFSLKVEETENRCPAGENYAKQNLAAGKIPIFSCEGACIRGEIARLAANMVGREEPYARCCHAETFTVSGSAMAEWVKKAEKAVVIDGCFLKCHGRVLKSLVREDKVIYFDALSHYKKYSDRFDIDSVPEEERKETARKVADWVLAGLNP
jgi:uncharacterized metal-binding protein